jgi:hypothetical protein
MVNEVLWEGYGRGRQKGRIDREASKVLENYPVVWDKNKKHFRTDVQNLRPMINELKVRLDPKREFPSSYSVQDIDNNLRNYDVIKKNWRHRKIFKYAKKYPLVLSTDMMRRRGEISILLI